jgi:hypothetical protein
MRGHTTTRLLFSSSAHAVFKLCHPSIRRRIGGELWLQLQLHRFGLFFLTRSVVTCKYFTIPQPTMIHLMLGLLLVYQACVDPFIPNSICAVLAWFLLSGSRSMKLLLVLIKFRSCQFCNSAYHRIQGTP